MRGEPWRALRGNARDNRIQEAPTTRPSSADISTLHVAAVLLTFQRGLFHTRLLSLTRCSASKDTAATAIQIARHLSCLLQNPRRPSNQQSLVSLSLHPQQVARPRQNPLVSLFLHPRRRGRRRSLLVFLLSLTNLQTMTSLRQRRKRGSRQAQGLRPS